MNEYHFKILGMHCESCGKIIQMDLEEVSGVISSSIDVAGSKGIVKIMGDVSYETVIKSIKNSGYEAQIEKEKNG